jgi:hypothetical protein
VLRNAYEFDEPDTTTTQAASYMKRRFSDAASLEASCGMLLATMSPNRTPAVEPRHAL